MTNSIDVEKLARHARDETLWLRAAKLWYELYQPFVPLGDTGRLCREVRFSPGAVEHTAPYARAVYEGKGSPRRDRHPLASRYWDRAARASQQDALLRALQAYVDGGGLRLRG